MNDGGTSHTDSTTGSSRFDNGLSAILIGGGAGVSIVLLIMLLEYLAS